MLDVDEARFRRRMFRHEKLAAVLVRHRGNLERADAPRLIDNLLLVHADERPENRQRSGLLDHGHILERLRSHLREALAGRESQRVFLPRDRLRDAQHHPAVEHDPQRSQNGGDDRSLDLAERHEVEPRLELMPRQQAHQLAAFFLGRAIEIRRAVKMDESKTAAALHHAVGRDRRVESAGYETDDTPGRADRQAAEAGDLLEAEECAFRQDLDIDRHLGVFQIHARAGPCFHGGPEDPVDLRRSQRKALVRPARLDAKRRETPPVDAAENTLAQRVDVGRDALDEREVRDAEDSADAARDLFAPGIVAEREQDARLQRLRFLDSEAAQRRYEVALQKVDEVRPVAFLQRDLVIADQDGMHAVKIADSSLICRAAALYEIQESGGEGMANFRKISEALAFAGEKMKKNGLFETERLGDF